MITRHIFSFAMGLLTALPISMAQTGGTIEVVGNTTASAMMVRLNMYARVRNSIHFV